MCECTSINPGSSVDVSEVYVDRHRSGLLYRHDSRASHDDRGVREHLPRAIEHTRGADPDVPLLRVNDGRGGQHQNG